MMKMPSGGFRPAYNVELATDVDSGVVLGVDVVNVGSDKGQMSPMVRQIEGRYGVKPGEYLADGDFPTSGDIDDLTGRGVVVYAPVRKRQGGGSNVEPSAGDSPAVVDWRLSMSTPEAQRIYRRRTIAERINAGCRNRGLRQVLVEDWRKCGAWRCGRRWRTMCRCFCERGCLRADNRRGESRPPAAGTQSPPDRPACSRLPIRTSGCPQSYKRMTRR